MIIGAGFAGLYFVHKFKPENYLILEKENRIGGRVYNINWNNQQISLGGGILRFNDMKIIKLCEEFGLDAPEFESSYYLIDLDGPIPNEDLYYEPNKVIINYLKKVFITNKEEIQRQKMSFKQFLYEYLEYHIAQTIIDNLLYLSYLDSDVQSVLDDKIYQLMRVEPFKARFIKQSGYTGLLNKLIESVGISNIKLNSKVNLIRKNKNIYEIVCSNGVKYTCDRLILATEKNPKINIEMKEVLEAYEMMGSCPYIRSYSYWNSGHKITNSIRTQNYPGKVIKISDKILMSCYTECDRALQLNKWLEKNSKTEQKKIICDLLVKSNINVECPDDFIYIYWDVGTHYIKPSIKYSSLRDLIKKIAKESNIYLVGEVFAESHGWVNCALESVDLLYNELV